MSPAKVTLSPKELELVINSDWILTKNTIIGKVYTLFGELNEVYGGLLQKHSFTCNGIDLTSAKIAKGEQYEGLPWVMLDRPRHFASGETFAVRSFFWWGNFCSITLQLSGQFIERYSGSIENYFSNNNREGWYLCSNEDAWQHHFREDNYQLIEERTILSLKEKPFLKLAKKIPLTDFDSLRSFYEKSFEEMVEMLGR